MLAGLFPEQRVISIWEGNNNVLGYQGFAHWLGSGKRLDNLDIIFTHPDHALPLADDCVRVIHGLDSLHRYRHVTFIPECLRVCQDDGVLIFPHVHLTNSQPEPFFERGCQQYHGQEWKGWLDRLLAGSQRSAWVLPEVELFDAQQDLDLADQSNTHHYNALILIADKKYQGYTLEPCQNLPITAGSRFISNPLVETDLHRCRVRLAPECLAGQAADMLDRHPCYRERLEKVAGSTLTSMEARFIWHARQALDLRSIAQEMRITRSVAREIGSALCHRELLHPAPVSHSMAELQDFHTFVELPTSKPACFSDLWKDAMECYGQRAMLRWLEDDSELQVDEVLYLVDALRAQLVAEGLAAGSRILICSEHHPEALLVCWAAWLQGMVTVLVDSSLPHEEIERLENRSKAELCFTSDETLNLSLAVRCIVFDGERTAPAASFSGWIESSLGNSPPAPVEDPHADAVMLFTSGSTGSPKGVILGQSALCSSGLTMVEAHGWNAERLLSLGPLSMMSGLRNPAVAAPASGSTILVPGSNSNRLPINAWQEASAAQATVITAVPAWLASIMRLADRLDPAPDLRQVLLTGTSLGAAQRAEAEESLGVTIGDYYGLTETGGICTASLDETDAGTLGRPVNALLHILGENDDPVSPGETGRLRVHSDQLMSGYLDDPAGTAKVLLDGWLLTGDLAHWDTEGRLVLDGREDEIIKLRNGLRFHPMELEHILAGMEGVDEAAVVVDGENLDIIALVVARVDRNVIREKLSARVAPHLMPVQFVKVPDLPINSNGKLMRSELVGILRQNTDTSPT